MKWRVCDLAPSKNVSVVQWIEYRIPVPTIRVRLPTGIQVKGLFLKQTLDLYQEMIFMRKLTI